MTEEVAEGPNWLKELEARRERRLKAKLGHESGAGSPCLTCKDACPGLDLHFWRKICKNCKCGKESHDVQDDDIYGMVQFQLLGSKPNKSRKIVLPGKKEEVELEWAPKGQKEIVDNFLKELPQEMLPVKGSAAAQERKQQLQKQIPLHDIDPTLCHALTADEVEQMNNYIDHIKEKSIGVGQIVQLNTPQANAKLVSSKPMPHIQQNLNNAVEKPHHANILSPKKSNKKINLPELEKNLRNLNLFYKKLDDLPVTVLREVQFGVRDIIYDQNLNYPTKLLNDCELEKRFDGSKNCVVLTGKRNEFGGIDIMHLNNKLGKLPNYNLYNKKLGEIPENVLQQVQLGWRDIEFDTNVIHDPVELQKIGLEPSYCKQKKILVLKPKKGFVPIVEEKYPICMGNLENLTGALHTAYPQGLIHNYYLPDNYEGNYPYNQSKHGFNQQQYPYNANEQSQNYPHYPYDQGTSYPSQGFNQYPYSEGNTPSNVGLNQQYPYNEGLNQQSNTAYPYNEGSAPPFNQQSIPHHLYNEGVPSINQSSYPIHSEAHKANPLSSLNNKFNNFGLNDPSINPGHVSNREDFGNAKHQDGTLGDRLGYGVNDPKYQGGLEGFNVNDPNVKPQYGNLGNRLGYGVNDPKYQGGREGSDLNDPNVKPQYGNLANRLGYGVNDPKYHRGREGSDINDPNLKPQDGSLANKSGFGGSLKSPGNLGYGPMAGTHQTGDNKYGSPNEDFNNQHKDNSKHEDTLPGLPFDSNALNAATAKWNNPLNLPKYSDFVKDALSKIKISNELTPIEGEPLPPLDLNKISPDSDNIPERPPVPVDYNPYEEEESLRSEVQPGQYIPHRPYNEYNPSNIRIPESVQNPIPINIGAINDITYPGVEVKEAPIHQNEFYDPSYQQPSNDQQSTIQEKMQKPCYKCGKGFENDSYAITLERNDALCHVNCLKCAGCNQSLVDMIYFYDKETDDIYCGRDYAKIRGFHRCYACDELIFVKEYCLAENMTFHVKHFCCYDCDTPLAGQKYVVDDNSQPICLPCYEKFNSEHCNTCKKAIQAYEQGAKLENVHFHADDNCFACKMCQKPLLGNKFMFKNTNLYCSVTCFKQDQ